MEQPETLTLISNTQPCSSSWWLASKSWCTARGMTPRCWGSEGPTIVYVLPLPVCPYAKMHTCKG